MAAFIREEVVFPDYRYWYEEVTTGYPWNTLAYCTNAIGLEPIGSGNVSGQTYLEFTRQLTETEKSKLDAYMAGTPGFPPTETTNSVYRIKDIWETRQEFNTKLGNLPFFIYYNESVPGSGLFDRIELHFQKGLNAAEKNKIVDEYSKLIALLVTPGVDPFSGSNK